MQVFLGDVITLMREDTSNPTMVTGQVAGIVLDDHKKPERIYIHGIDAPFWVSRGWLFVDEGEEEE